MNYYIKMIFDIIDYIFNDDTEKENNKTNREYMMAK